MARDRFVIAIDGPAASGKSTTAKLVADRLGYIHVDTGAMYRAVTLKVLHSGVKPGDERRIGRLLDETIVQLSRDEAGLRVLLDGKDVTEEIRSPKVTAAVSMVSSIRAVRAAMVRNQRRMGEAGGIVLEGRDIGTVVFPDADLKFFVTADSRERARRRLAELRGVGTDARLEDLERELRERDHFDSTRDESPLRQAPDAITLDTSALTIEEQVDVIVAKVNEKLEKRVREE